MEAETGSNRKNQLSCANTTHDSKCCPEAFTGARARSNQLFVADGAIFTKQQQPGRACGIVALRITHRKVRKAVTVDISLDAWTPCSARAFAPI